MNKAKTLRATGAAIGLSGLLLGSSALIAGTAGATSPNLETDHKIRICHRTNSESNPYTSNEVDIASANGMGGSGDHYLNHTGPIGPIAGADWGDIIPPIAGSHDGLNWTTAGQAIWNNDCNLVPTTTSTTTTTTTAPSSTTTSTTTTAPSSTTTSTTTTEATSTTTEATTTTTEAPTSTTTTVPASVLGTSTVVSPSTSTPPAVLGATTVPAAVLGTSAMRGNALAATGSSTGVTFAAGMALVAVGAIMVRRSAKLS